ncbi:hypothetical protein HZ326_19765 [Fusarium oxysporum f. sp. albedinis]|nr:hypothetical protein HZ326_19765 [Fusarium oxysporum f. sp. albedinis]
MDGRDKRSGRSNRDSTTSCEIDVQRLPRPGKKLIKSDQSSKASSRINTRCPSRPNIWPDQPGKQAWSPV